ncbi:hypothetical protein NST07_02540 [Paenibacillus sp. FSL L8-0340]|uniref:WD40/YVTN/BNR-like repeat-containing protein n=1 Tax=Paenibacillus sp. FSL L8-0340 TaxID=2954685 RepID=UPI003158DC24
MRVYKILASLFIAGTLLISASTIGATPAQSSSITLKGYPDNFQMTGVKEGWGITLGGVWHTADGALSWKHPLSNTVPMPGNDVQLGKLAHYFTGDNEAWILSAYGPHKPTALFHTLDKGKSWKTIRLPVKKSWEQGYASGFMHFPDKQGGYILLCSEPALGMMEKSLYRTVDGGTSWSRAGDLTASIAAYPTGITFRDSDNGWITSSNHGQKSILTFRTADGGKSWKPEKLISPSALSGYAYSNSYPPVFSGKDKKDGVLPLEIVLNGVKSMVFYTSNNGGETWKHGPGIQGVEASRTAWLNARSGWALQAGGRLLATGDGGGSWKQVAKGSAFDKATEIQFSTSRTGWISGPEILWSTADGGHTWRNLLIPS